jgi:hypothetical protein
MNVTDATTTVDGKRSYQRTKQQQQQQQQQ